MSRPTAKPKVIAANERVAVTKWMFAEGAESGWHRQGIIVPIGDGSLTIEEPGGESRAVTLTDRVAYRRNPGVAHNVINSSAGPYAFLEIEIKQRA